MKYKESLSGTVFDISRYCLNDGPGIRTTVFLKGCPLRCVWCHNPESQRIHPDIMFSEKSCVLCGECVIACRNSCHTFKEKAHAFDRSKCIGCGKCTDVCQSGALRLVGRNFSAEEVMDEVLKDKTFFNTSDGGLTVSGGEPTLQIDFLEHLLILAKREGIHTAVETCGYAPQKSFERIAPFTDLFLFDYKESDFNNHLIFTGKSLRPILDNLAFLNSINASAILRVPLIPKYNDTEDHINGIKELVKRFRSIKKIEVLPYHSLGVSKEAELGWSPKEAIDIPNKECLEIFIKRIREGIDVAVEACI